MARTVDPRNGVEQTRAYRDGAARRTAARRVPSSTMRPAYMTQARSQTSANGAEIVADENASPCRFRRADRISEVEDLRLDRRIKRRGRLVGDQQVGLAASAMAIIKRWH